MADVDDAVHKWLLYVESQRQTRSANDSQRLLAIALEDMEPPPMPEIYGLILQSRGMETPYIDGALSQWPVLFLMEWEAALASERRTVDLIAQSRAVPPKPEP